jgi:tRNA-Thr(GGU) m(6)t(6)A37 methyltransferase TsaA
MTLCSIGVVRCEVRERKAMPPLGVPAQVELFPQYADGLLRLEKHSHIWVLAWLEGAERDVLQVTPRGVTDPGPDGLHGVFAVRSPARPNPIGLTAARVLSRQGLTLELVRLDFADGTPVIDLKPYFLSRDLVFSAFNAPIGRPATRQAVRDSLLMQALSFHGELCPGLALGVRIVEHFRSEVLGLSEPEQWKVHVPLGRPCLIDALMGITRATPGRGSLLFQGSDSVRLEHRGAVYEYLLAATGQTDPAAILAASAEQLFVSSWRRGADK